MARDIERLTETVQETMTRGRAQLEEARAEAGSRVRVLIAAGGGTPGRAPLAPRRRPASSDADASSTLARLEAANDALRASEARAASLGGPRRAPRLS